MKYNPYYDPLHDKTPGLNAAYAPTYWVDSISDMPKDDGRLNKDITTDVAIIGSGFTGLTTALVLARDYGIKAVVLEANKVAWGCSSRNGGQAQLLVGRLSRSQWIDKWGVDIAKQMHNEAMDGFNFFKSLIKDHHIDCDPNGDGHIYIAHNKPIIDVLKKKSQIDRKIFGYNTDVISKAALIEKYLNQHHAHGALVEPMGIGIHPMKLVAGYVETARKYGAKIHVSSAVIDWQEQSEYHCLRTKHATIKAKKVVVATGGYMHSSLHKPLEHRYMPVLSNSLVTRPLNDSEIQACGFKTNLILSDTRILRFYYRLLPDNRIQIGSRSAITGKDATNKKHYDLLVNGLCHKFPVLKGIKIDYSWWGWVDVSHDMIPRIVESNTSKNVFYGFGYGGNAVAFSAQAGRRLAQRVAGKFDSKNLAHLPIYNSQLKRHLFTPYRRIGQRLLYAYYHLSDNLHNIRKEK